MRFTPSTTTIPPSVIFFCSASAMMRFAFLELLEILTRLVAPEHALKRGLVEVVINVMEGVLSDVTND
jgi:hypothetical protein